MFTDFLYRQINKNLCTETPLFPQIGEKEMRRAITLIKEKTALSETDETQTLARYLFARTLKEQIENPKSELSVYLQDNVGLRNILRDVYMQSIAKTNIYLGRPVVAKMPGPFVLNGKAFITEFGKVKKRISSGAYGVVYETVKGYVMKVFKERKIRETTVLETAILHYLNHPNVINPIGFTFGPQIVLAMPLAMGTLDDLKAEMGYIAVRQSLFYQILRGLAYCHSKYIWHLDIKPPNILYFEQDGTIVVKIADFGMSETYMRPGRRNTVIVTLLWRAPELLLGDSDYTESVDIWSVGVMLLDAIVGEYVLMGDSDIGQLFKIFGILGTPTPAIWPNVDKLPHWQSVFPKFPYILDKKLKEGGVWKNETNQEEFDLLSQLLAWPTKRISAIDALKSSYFNPIRDNVDTLLPAPPIVIESCGKVMLHEQPELIGQSWMVPSKRKILFLALYSMSRIIIRTKTQAIFLTFVLFDLYSKMQVILNDDLQKIGFMTFKISADMYGPRSDSIGGFASRSGISKKELYDAYKDIITKLDFNLVIPTCSDFMYEYLAGENVEQKKITALRLVAVMLMADYTLAMKYTQAQLAQIAIEAMGLHPVCLRDVPKLLNNDILHYLINAWIPTPEIKLKADYAQIVPMLVEPESSHVPEVV